MDTMLPTLITATPDEGFQLAVKLARLGIRTTQPDDAVRARLRPVYSESTADLIASSHVIAVHFQTVAAANNYWRP
ncbi:MAG: hexameric tyrosine-coordinated heme protein [Sphingomonas sp.]